MELIVLGRLPEAMEIQEQLEGLPGYDIIQGLWDEYAGEKLQTKDPFEDENGNRRRLPAICTRQEQKLFRSIQTKAWQHDRCFLGSCGVGLDCGLGLVPLVVLILPVIGPLMMYIVHQRLVRIASEKFSIPTKLDAQLNANIAFDMLITFPPLIGCFLGWMNACSTRNASLLYDYMIFVAEQRLKNPSYIGKGPIRLEPSFGDHIPMLAMNQPQQSEMEATTHHKHVLTRKKSNNIPTDQIVVDSHQQLGFV